MTRKAVRPVDLEVMRLVAVEAVDDHVLLHQFFDGIGARHTRIVDQAVESAKMRLDLGKCGTNRLLACHIASNAKCMVRADLDDRLLEGACVATDQAHPRARKKG